MYVRPRPRFRPRNAGGVVFSPLSLFTSGVAGAWYDPSDVLLNWRTNLLTYSQEFDNAAWVTSSATITADSTTAPDGTTTADTITFSSVAGRIQRAVNMASQCISIYAKPIVGTRFAINTDGVSGADATVFNLSGSGSVVSTGANNNSSVITALPNGWYRISTARGSTAGTNIYLGALNSGGGSTDSFYIWGAQLELGSTATTYQAITTPEQTYLLYDPQPVLFQDSAGTTPVTAVEQPVGLMLDKSQGLVLGSELVTNGDFSSGTGWTLAVGATISGGGLNFSAVSSSAAAYQACGIATNKTYLFTFTVVSISAGSVYAQLNGGSNVVAPSVSSPGTYTARLTNSASNGIISIGAIGATCVIDNISVKEIAGNHARQATPTSCPVLRARYNLALQSETLSNAAWSNGNILNGTRSNGSVSVTNSEGYAYIQQIGTYTTTVDHTISFDVVCDQTINNVPIRVGGTTNVYTLVNFVAGQTQRITLTGYRPAAAYFEFGIDARNAVVPGGSDATGYVVTFNRVDLRLSSTSASMPNYQRIAAATDYATAGFLPYLYFVTDDSFGTNSIDFTATDKMSVCAGVTKLSDAVSTMLAELSSNASTNNGSFYLSTTNSGGGGVTIYSNKGSLPQSFAFTTISAPVTYVLTGLGDISGDLATLRVDGAQVAQSTADQGAGNYGNWPLYIGRRNNASLPFNGNFYQLVVVGKTLSASELASTEAYVATKTGVTL